MENKINHEMREKMVTDPVIRKAITRNSHFWFFVIYFYSYCKYGFAPFHYEIFKITEDEDNQLVCITAFRGSGKSTLITLSYTLWAILGVQQKKFVMILSQTRVQAKQHMMNLKSELESNALLKRDLGPFNEDTDEWGSSSLVFSRSGARISVGSIEQSIRGMRHHEHRPDLIICDDIEDTNSVVTHENREKTYKWFTSELIPLGNTNTRIIIVGNWLHEDSLIARIKESIDDGTRKGLYRSYPLADLNGHSAWPAKFPDFTSLENLRKMVGDEITWQREYLLKIVPSHDQVVFPEWIQTYEKLPNPKNGTRMGTFAAVDLAVSLKTSADHTAILSAEFHRTEEGLKIYILPRIINQKMTMPETIRVMKAYLQGLGEGSKLFVEAVGIQEGYVQTMLEDGYDQVEGVRPIGDKRTRLALTTPFIQNGTILFPRKGAEELIRQMVGLGSEKRDDLVDAFSIVIQKIIEFDKDNSGIDIHFI